MEVTPRRGGAASQPHQRDIGRDARPRSGGKQHAPGWVDKPKIGTIIRPQVTRTVRSGHFHQPRVSGAAASSGRQHCFTGAVLLVLPTVPPAQARVEIEERQLREDQAAVDPEVRQPLRQTRHAAVVPFQPVPIRHPVGRLVALDDLEDLDERPIRCDDEGFEENVDLPHAAELRQHDDSAKLAEEGVVSDDRSAFQIVDVASERDLDEAIDVAAGTVDGIGHLTPALEIAPEHQIVLPLVGPVLLDLGDEIHIVRAPGTNPLQHPIQAAVAAVLVVDVDRCEDVEVSAAGSCKHAPTLGDGLFPGQHGALHLRPAAVGSFGCTQRIAAKPEGMSPCRHLSYKDANVSRKRRVPVMMLFKTMQPQRLLSKMSRRSRSAVALALGVASAFSFAPYSLWPLMLGAFCGLVWLLDAKLGSKDAAALGWLFGFGQFSVSLYWISISFQFQADMPAWLGFVAVAALAGYLALYPALALWLASRSWTDSPSRILILAASWTATEWLRGHLLTGFPWTMVAQVWSETPVMLQAARLFGAYGLTLFTVALIATVALLVDRRASARRYLLIAAASASLLFLDGWRRLQDGESPLREDLRVHLVQADVRQDLEADPERQRGILELYERMTAAALRLRGPGIVIWPETAVEYDIEGDRYGRIRLAQTIGESGTLILGAVGQRLGPRGEWTGSRNSLLVVDGRGAVRAVYDKTRLVPFGEYLPAGSILSRLGLASVTGGTDRFIAGRGPATLAPGLPPFSPLICYEIIFPGAVTEAGTRPEWLLNISNDAWFGDSWGPYQHFAQARLRAVEEGLPVVRSTPTGISGVIDPYGRVLTRTRLRERAVLTAYVPTPLPSTLYARYGDWLFLALLLAFAALGRWSAHRSSRSTPDPPPDSP